jgi:hypothetical protein
MTTDQQEIFVLELTYCQLMKANRPLYGELCASLTEERMMQQKEVITHFLVGASAAVSQQMQNVLGEVTSVSEKLNEHHLMVEDMTTHTTIVFEQLQSEAMLMAEQHKAHAQAVVVTMELMTNQSMIVLERVQEEVTIVIAEQQKAHEHATAMVLEKVELETVALIVEQYKSHERASELHIEEITQQTARILEKMQAETAMHIETFFPYLSPNSHPSLKCLG